MSAIADFIAANPGATQNRVIEALNLRRGRAHELLRRFEGERWRVESGPRGARLFFPMQAGATSTPILVQISK